MRDVSVGARGRQVEQAGASAPIPHRAASAQPHLQETRYATGLERHPSNAYNHNRQASVINGLHHSRNTSFAGSATPSPLRQDSALGSGPAEHVSPYSDGMLTNGISMNGASANGTMAGENGPGPMPNGGAYHRKTPSTRSRRGHTHHNSRSKHSEPRSAGEFALHHLLNSFVVQADHKINHSILSIGEQATPVELICGPGVDPTFDQLIAALGHVARQKPKPLVDSLMFWRKAKGELASAAKQRLAQHQQQQQRPIPLAHGLPAGLPSGLPRRNTEPTNVQPGSTDLPIEDDAAGTGLSTSPADDAIYAERRATVSVYLVCRVLIEVFEQSTLGAITSDLAQRLEEIVFGQLKAVDPAQLASSSLRMANWRIYATLLGRMSAHTFGSVTNKFLIELDSCQKEIARQAGSLQAKDAEARAELLILGLRHLKIRTQPENAWAQSCEFLKYLIKLFVDAHGPNIKQSYCQILEKLLLPIAGDRNCDIGSPAWRECLEMLVPRLNQMLTKPRHWHAAFPLYALILCVSPKESFLAQWQLIIANLNPKLKDRTTRPLALQAICRLTWTYLYRIAEAQPPAVRKLEEVIRVALPPGRKTHLSTEHSVSDPLIQLIRIIGFRYLDVCWRTILHPMLHTDIFLSSKDVKFEQLEPEKMVIGIRAFLAIMSDCEDTSLKVPPFPHSFISTPPAESLPTSPMFIRPQLLTDPRPQTSGKDESVLRMVDVACLDNVAKACYTRFCDVLGRIALLCDSAFGGQAAINEKFNSPISKTPLSETFGFTRKDDGTTVDPRQGFYDLFLTAVQALPRALSESYPLSTIISLLCTGTAHVQSSIATSSAQSLKSMAIQGYSQQVTIGFARFIFSFDDKYSTMSDEGLLGPGHIETTLTLYTELLKIFCEQLRQRKIEAASGPVELTTSRSRGLKLDLSNGLHHVDEIESHGLFFLFSQSRRVRSFAMKVLGMVVELDKALGKQNARVIKILEDETQKILDVNDDRLSVAERTRVQQGKRKSSNGNTLIEICSSDVSYDSTLWSKIFPNLIRAIYDACPYAITMTRDLVNTRLIQMQESIEALSGSAPRQAQTSSPDYRPIGRSSNQSPEILIEQWKLYLVMACVTLSSIGAQSQSQLQNAVHMRKTSKGEPTPDKIASARALFSAVIPLLSSSRASIRNACVSALGSINPKLYRTLLESLQYAVIKCNDEAKQKLGLHHRSPSTPPTRNRKTDLLRTEVTHVYKLTSAFLKDAEVHNDDWIVNNLVTYTKDLRLFLSDTEVQSDWEFQRLRLYYCGLLEEVFEGIQRTKDSSRWMSFESRKSAFALMEEWCGFSPHTSHREESLKQVVMSPSEASDRGNFTAAMEIDKKNLKTASLSAMASLCQGPISTMVDNKVVQSFNVPRMLTWIEGIFSTQSDKHHGIGRRALKNLVIHNKEYPTLLEHAIDRCYGSSNAKIFESYFKVVTDVLIEHDDYQLPFWRVLALVLFTLGNEDRDIRMQSARLLRTLEERQQKSSKLQDFDISISDKTTAVYKLAQFEYSRRLSKAHAELAYTIFSEFSFQFKKVNTDYQRNMVAAILPWIQAIELKVDPSGGPTALSSMLLSNLFEITIRHSGGLHNEVQALWQALATGPHGGNVQLVLDFIFSLCLDKRDQNFVDYAKQVVVYLAATPAGSKVIEFFLLQMVPKNMVQEKRERVHASPDIKGIPYVCDLNEVLPPGSKQAGFSLGQISLIFLVDLMVAPISLTTENAIKIIHVSLILWDHYNLTVQEQSREMLVHLLHELVTSKLDDATLAAQGRHIESLVDSIRQNTSSVIWSYEDSNGKEEDDTGNKVPSSMVYLTKEVVGLFGMVHEDFGDLWAKEALSWASSCPVRHLACRSFQIFRCVSTTVDSRMLADMLARLSNTIADEETDYQTFSMEILTTLKVIIDSLLPDDLLRHPQLFWTTCACLNTIHEREFVETLSMLERLISRLDLGDPAIVQALMDSQPARWEGAFEGLQPLIYRGLKSCDALDQTLTVLNQMMALPSNDAVGDNRRLLFTVLANVPNFLHHFEFEEQDISILDCALQLANVAEDLGYGPVASCLTDFANQIYSKRAEFLDSMMTAIETCFFPEQDAQTLIFLMGLLFNKTTWWRINVMEILCLLIPTLDMRKPDIACHGPELITPLMRLLQTELCPQALRVMDNILEVSGNPLEKEHIRMSMASGSARAIRKEYSNTQSLYGIPVATGWSIPMPAVHARTTRNNVHAVFYTCADTETQTEVAETPEVEFHADDYPDSYFGPRHSGTLKSIETTADNNMGDLISKLDSLDDFFDDPEFDESSDNGTRLAGGYHVDMHENVANIYDQQTAPILNKSLARTASTSSFQNGLAESRAPVGGYAMRDPMAMNPGAFAPSAGSSSLTNMAGAQQVSTVRPPLHGRSVTSPATNLPMLQEVNQPPLPDSRLTIPKTSFSDDEDNSNYYNDDAVLSDSDTAFPNLVTQTQISPAYTSPSTYTPISAIDAPMSAGPYSSVPRSATANEANPFSFQGMRRGMRRLTGGRDRDRDRLRTQHPRGVSPSPSHGGVPMSGSPRVPKVPAEYLNGPGPGSPNL